MSTPPTDSSAYAIELDGLQSQRLLEHATQSGAEISILPHTRSDGLPVLAAIVGSTEEGLLLKAKDNSPADSMSLISVYCEATVVLSQARFLFSTNIIDVVQEGDDLQLEIVKPSHLHVLQRRRYKRRNLRGKTPVRIMPVDRADQPVFEAAMLNVSTGGLACRIDQTDADHCALEHRVQLEFALVDCEETFHLPARVRGKTPGASPGQIILAVEFESGIETESEREKLAEALYSNLTALTGE